MNNIKLKQIILDALKADERLWNKDKTELNQTLLLDLIEHFDETVIDLLLQEKELRDKFFVKINKKFPSDRGVASQSDDRVFVFKTNDFRFFMEENKVDNSYTQYKNRIGLTDGKKFLKDTNDVVLNWPYKDCVLEGGQSTEEGLDTYFEYDEKTKQYETKQGKRKEIFFNEVLAYDEIDRLFDHKALINWKRYTKEGEQKVKEIKRDDDGTIKENLIIKGNNLLALHSLKKQFAGKVKLIYIDPPYNTGNDGFKYNDNFNHSTWLTFMKNRLEVARELLRDDGVIFVQCDDNEQAYLKVLMDEVFGRENFVNTIALRVSPPEGVKTSHATNTILKEKEYLHVYSRNKNLMTVIPCYIRADKWDTHYSSYIENIYEPIGNWKVVPLSKKLKEESLRPDLDDKDFVKWITNNSNKIFQLIDAGKYKNIQKYREDRFQWTDDKKIIIYRGRKVHFLSEGLKTTDEGLTLGRLLCDFWKDISFNNLFQEGGVSLIWGKKPEKLIKRILDMFTNANDIVLDYHLGTGTTCAVAHKMGRQYIGIEQLDYGENDSVVRLQDVINGDQSGISKSVNWQGGGNFIYFELAKWNETAKEKILECESLEELEKFFDEMYEKYFLNYNLKIKEFKEKVLKEENFRNLSLDEQKKIFVSMLDNNQMYVNKTEMADKKFGISEEDQNLTNQFYNKEE